MNRFRNAMTGIMLLVASSALSAEEDLVTSKVDDTQRSLAAMVGTEDLSSLALGEEMDMAPLDDEVEAMGRESSDEETAAPTPRQPTTTWRCWYQGQAMGTVTIWWGHTAADAEWACDNWISQCGNAPGGCTATEF